MKKLIKKLLNFGKENTKNIFLKPEKIYPQLLKKGQKISYIWGDKVRIGIIKRNFVNSSFLFVKRTDSGKYEYNEVMYYQILEVLPMDGKIKDLEI